MGTAGSAGRRGRSGSARHRSHGAWIRGLCARKPPPSSPLPKRRPIPGSGRRSRSALSQIGRRLAEPAYADEARARAVDRVGAPPAVSDPAAGSPRREARRLGARRAITSRCRRPDRGEEPWRAGLQPADRDRASARLWGCAGPGWLGRAGRDQPSSAAPPRPAWAACSCATGEGGQDCFGHAVGIVDPRPPDASGPKASR